MYAGTFAWDSLTKTEPRSSVSLAKHSAAFTEYGAFSLTVTSFHEKNLCSWTLFFPQHPAFTMR